MDAMKMLLQEKHIHYRNRHVRHAPQMCGECQNTHGEAFTVRNIRKRTVKAAR
jgi:hypothetical protein